MIHIWHSHLRVNGATSCIRQWYGFTVAEHSLAQCFSCLFIDSLVVFFRASFILQALHLNIRFPSSSSVRTHVRDAIREQHMRHSSHCESIWCSIHSRIPASFTIDFVLLLLLICYCCAKCKCSTGNSWRRKINSNNNNNRFCD